MKTISLNNDGILFPTDFDLVVGFNSWFNKNKEIIQKEFESLPVDVASQFTPKEFGLEIFSEI